jgi:hypothetical protein
LLGWISANDARKSCPAGGCSWYALLGFLAVRSPAMELEKKIVLVYNICIVPAMPHTGGIFHTTNRGSEREVLL